MANELLYFDGSAGLGRSDRFLCLSLCLLERYLFGFSSNLLDELLFQPGLFTLLGTGRGWDQPQPRAAGIDTAVGQVRWAGRLFMISSSRAPRCVNETRHLQILDLYLLQEEARALTRLLELMQYRIGCFVCNIATFCRRMRIKLCIWCGCYVPPGTGSKLFSFCAHALVQLGKAICKVAVIFTRCC